MLHIQRERTCTGMCSRVVEITFGCSYIVLSHSLRVVVDDATFISFLLSLFFSPSISLYKSKVKEFQVQNMNKTISRLFCALYFVFRHVNCMRSFALDMIYCLSATHDDTDPQHTHTHIHTRRVYHILWWCLHDTHARALAMFARCLSST